MWWDRLHHFQYLWFRSGYVVSPGLKNGYPGGALAFLATAYPFFPAAATIGYQGKMVNFS
jgi:hypothetical protein